MAKRTLTLLEKTMKIAFLFLIISTINHEKIWLDFFNHHQDDFSIHIHSKEAMPASSSFKQFELSTKVPTTWENTMNAQIELLREALKDENNQKFIFLSESTIPLQPFEFVYETLMADKKSQFAFERNYHPNRVWKSIPTDKSLKNPQWVILNRKHAELMVKDTTLINIMTKSPYDNEHYPSNFLSLNNLLHEIEPIDRTLVVWPKPGVVHPVNFKKIKGNKYTPLLINAIKEKKYLFARKFDKTCNLDYLKRYLPSPLLKGNL